jgi:sugar phosphate isomerase/epimerase
VAQTPQISVQLYSVAGQLAADPRATLNRLAAIGYRSVEPFSVTGSDAGFWGQLADAGLTTPTSHQELAGGDLDRVFAAASEHGVATVIDNSLAAGAWVQPIPDAWRNPDGIAAIADGLNAAAECARRHNVRVGYHNHHWELASRIDGRPGLEVLADQLDEAVALEVDVYWAAAGGADVPALLRRLGPRVRFLHVKDGPVQADFLGQRPVGQGAMPMTQILVAASYLEVAVVEFDGFDGDIFDGLTQSLAFLDAAAGTTTRPGAERE